MVKMTTIKKLEMFMMLRIRKYRGEENRKMPIDHKYLFLSVTVWLLIVTISYICASYVFTKPLRNSIKNGFHDFFSLVGYQFGIGKDFTP